MEFQYIGDDNMPPPRTVFMGYAFELGGIVDVVDEAAIAKLMNNRCFKCVEGKTDPADIEVLRADLTAAGVNFDGRWGAERLREELDRATVES